MVVPSAAARLFSTALIISHSSDEGLCLSLKLKYFFRIEDATEDVVEADDEKVDEITDAGLEVTGNDSSPESESEPWLL